MKFSDIPRNPDTRMLRQFAGLWILFFGAFGCYAYLHDRNVAWIWFTIAGGVGLPGMIRPQLLKPVFITWMVVAFPIGWIVSHLILLLIFCFVFTPMGFMLRTFGHDPLRLRKPKTDSYWETKPRQQDARRYLKQF